MREICVEFNNMLPVFAGTRVSQPYRHQRGMLLTVDFFEYVRFIEMIVQTGKQWLALPNSVYKKGLEKREDAGMRKLLYYDLYHVMLGELVLALKMQRSCTLIGAKFGDCDVQNINLQSARKIAQELSGYDKSLESVKEEFRNWMGGFDFTSSEYHQRVFDYAVLLRTLAFCKQPGKYEYGG